MTDPYAQRGPAAHPDAGDSVPLEALGAGGPPQAGGGPPRLRVGNLKLILALFIIFVVVVSDVFTNSIIAGFGEKAVRCRSPTSWGVVLQGIFLVLFYVTALYLIDRGIL